MPQPLRRLAASALLTVLALGVALASAATIVPNSPYQAGPNSVAIIGGGTAAEVAAGIAADSGMKVDALWLLKGGRWLFFLPAVPGVDGGLSIVPDPAAAVAVLSAGGGGGLPPAPGGAVPPSAVTTATMGPNGATVKRGDVTVKVPVGAMPPGATVSLSSASPSPLPTGYTATGQAYRLRTSAPLGAGATLSIPAPADAALTSQGNDGLGGLFLLAWGFCEDAPDEELAGCILISLILILGVLQADLPSSPAPVDTTVTIARSAAPPTAPLNVTLAATPRPAKVGQPVTYSVTATGGKGPYVYEVKADGAVVGTSSAGTVTFQTPGLHVIDVKVTDKNGTPKSAHVDVDVAAPLAVTLTGPATLEHGAGGTYTATITGGVAAYTLTFTVTGPGAVAPQTVPAPVAGSYPATFTFTLAGSYTVTATVTSADGQTSSAPIAVTVHEESGGGGGGCVC